MVEELHEQTDGEVGGIKCSWRVLGVVIFIMSKIALMLKDYGCYAESVGPTTSGMLC